MLSRHLLTVSDFQILIKSCSIESRNDPSPKSEVVHETKISLNISYSTHACLAPLDQHQTCKPVMVSVVSSNPSGGNFIFLRHLDANFVKKNARNVRFVLFTKTSIANSHDPRPLPVLSTALVFVLQSIIICDSHNIGKYISSLCSLGIVS